MLKIEGRNLDQVKANLILISSVSLNTTPSMALDILIASNGFQRIGFLESEHLEPAVGYLNKNIAGGSLGLAGELYQKDDVVILQLRSNVRFGRKKMFVEQIGNIFSTNIESNSVLFVGSLPESFRSDYEIQSASKNVYWTSKTKSELLSKSEENGLIKPLSLLISEDEEVTDVLGEVGVIKHVLKSEKFTNANYLCTFSKGLIDNEAAIHLAKTISAVTHQKELGLVDASILEN